MNFRPEVEYPAFELIVDHAQVTADTGPTKLYQVAAGRVLQITSVLYLNPTGLAGDATNAFAVEVRKGTVSTFNDVVARINTDTDDVPAGATIAANTFTAATLTLTNCKLVGGDELALLLDEDATATLPAGKLIIRGRFLA